MIGHFIDVYICLSLVAVIIEFNNMARDFKTNNVQRLMLRATATFQLSFLDLASVLIIWTTWFYFSGIHTSNLPWLIIRLVLAAEKKIYRLYEPR